MPAPKISRLVFHAGASVGAPSTSVSLGPVTILVGPNNSGKSLALREIENWTMGENHPLRVLREIHVHAGGDATEIERLLEPFRQDAQPGQSLPIGTFRYVRGQLQSRSQYEIHVRPQDVAQRLAATPMPPQARREFVAMYTARLDGKTRFNLASDQDSAPLTVATMNHLHGLLKDPHARQRVREVAFPPFREYFTVDPTQMKTLRMKLNPRPPADEEEEAGISTRAVAYHNAGRPIGDYSDGVQAFLGLTSAVMSLPCTIVLADEPEAFLHPPLARRLGSALATLARERAASLVAATHSSSFLAGCLDAGVDVSVIRVTFDGGQATTRSLPGTELRTITRDPLLRSTRALESLFHRSAIVTEAEADRAFYDEVNQRMLRVDGRGIADAIFLHAQNKQTIHRIVGPLRKLGIPAAAIVDLDFIRDTGVNWSNLLSACQVDGSDMDDLRSLRDEVVAGFDAVDASRPWKSGALSLRGTAEGAYHKLTTALGGHGLFMVEVGELEGWLSRFSIPRGNKTEWLVRTFERMGADPAEPTYAVASQGDVWSFLDRVGRWCGDPLRAGMATTF